MTRLKRILVYGLLIIGAFITAYIHGITIRNEERDKALQVLKREINSNWGLTKIEIDMINESVQSFVERNGLKPGQPLPTTLLNEDSPALRSLLKNMKGSYYVKTFPAASNEYSTKATALITISDKVPNEGEKYAYGAIEHSYEIFGSVYNIYPEDEYSVRRITKALKTYAKTLKK